MTQVDYPELQRRFGGQYIARYDTKVIASAGTHDELIDLLEQQDTRWDDVTIEFVEPADIVAVY